MYNGRSAYHFGTMVDVLDGCPKAEGMLMLIRAMSPQVIITDEIGKREDVSAIKACSGSGVKSSLLPTAAISTICSVPTSMKALNGRSFSVSFFSPTSRLSER